MFAIFKVFLNAKMLNLKVSVYSASHAKISGTCLLSMLVYIRTDVPVVCPECRNKLIHMKYMKKGNKTLPTPKVGIEGT